MPPQPPYNVSADIATKAQAGGGSHCIIDCAVTMAMAATMADDILNNRRGPVLAEGGGQTAPECCAAERADNCADDAGNDAADDGSGGRSEGRPGQSSR